MPDTEQPELARLTVELLSAFVSNNTISSDALPALIEATRSALAGKPTQEQVEVPEFKPAVSVEESIASRDHILSLIDGKPYKALKRHLANNGLTPEEYRARYNLPTNYPMVSPSYSEKRRAFAKAAGLGGSRAGASAEAGVPAQATKSTAPVAAKTVKAAAKKTTPKAAPTTKPSSKATQAPATASSVAAPAAKSPKTSANAAVSTVAKKAAAAKSEPVAAATAADKPARRMARTPGNAAAPASAVAAAKPTPAIKKPAKAGKKSAASALAASKPATAEVTAAAPKTSAPAVKKAVKATKPAAVKPKAKTAPIAQSPAPKKSRAKLGIAVPATENTGSTVARSVPSTPALEASAEQSPVEAKA